MLDGYIYSWGKNTHGQLGHSVGKSHVATPTAVSSLQSVPVARLAAGAGHSMAITVIGHVFAWGRNRYHMTQTCTCTVLVARDIVMILYLLVELVLLPEVLLTFEE